MWFLSSKSTVRFSILYVYKNFDTVSKMLYSILKSFAKHCHNLLLYAHKTGNEEQNLILLLKILNRRYFSSHVLFLHLYNLVDANP